MPYGFNEDKSKYKFGEGTILWEQIIPSNTFRFEAQSVTLNDSLNNYKSVEIIFNTSAEGYTAVDHGLSTGRIPIEHSSELDIVSRKQERKISILDDKTLHFFVGKLIFEATSNQTLWTYDDSSAVPMKIIGYRL